MSDSSGIEFIKSMNKSPHCNIPIIVLTSSDTMALRQELFSLGVIDYILKSDISKESFARYLKALIRNDELMKEVRQMPIAVLDDSHFSLKVIEKVFHMFKINNVDYFDKASVLLNSDYQYALYILDIVLPEKSGEEVVLALRDRYEDSRIIAISSLDNYKTISNILTAGADDFIIKPFDFNIFMAKVKTNARTYSLIQHMRVRMS